MQATETLTFSVNLWSEDELRIEAVLAAASSLSIGRVAFDSACLSYPDRMLTLIGPGTLETRPAAEPEQERGPASQRGSFGIVAVL